MTNGRPPLWVGLLSLGVALGVAYLTTGFPLVRTPDFSSGSDAITDWLTVNAAWAGEDPYRNLGELLEPHFEGVTSSDPPVELPGTFIIQSVLALTNAGQAVWVNTLVVLVAIGVLVLLACRGIGLGARPAMVAFPVLLVTRPAIQALALGNISVAYLALVLMAWTGARSGRYRWMPGVLLGIAVAGRGWPLLIAFVFATVGLYRHALIAAVTASSLTGLGVVLVGTQPLAQLASVSGSAQVWMNSEANASVIALVSRYAAVPSLALAAVVTGCVVWASYRLRHQPDKAIALSCLGAVAASPVAWPFYYLICVPWIPFAWRSPPARWFLAPGVVLMAVSFEAVLAILSAMCIAAGFVLGDWARYSQPKVGPRATTA